MHAANVDALLGVCFESFVLVHNLISIGWFEFTDTDLDILIQTGGIEGRKGKTDSSFAEQDAELPTRWFSCAGRN